MDRSIATSQCVTPARFTRVIPPQSCGKFRMPIIAERLVLHRANSKPELLIGSSRDDHRLRRLISKANDCFSAFPVPTLWIIRLPNGTDFSATARHPRTTISQAANSHAVHVLLDLFAFR